MPEAPLRGVVVACRRSPDAPLEAGSDAWLLIRRSAHVAAPLRLCLPGGTIETGECPESAAHREMLEELGVEIELRAELGTVHVRERRVELFGFYAALRSPVLRPNPEEVAEVCWLPAEIAARHPEALPSTGLFFEALGRRGLLT